LRVKRVSQINRKGVAEDKGGNKVDEPTVVIYEAPSQGMSFVVKEALENAGFPVAEMVDVATWGDGAAPRLARNSYSRLLTLESRAEEARQFVADFLAAYERGDLTLPE
jgi:hypothetical protein